MARLLEGELRFERGAEVYRQKVFPGKQMFYGVLGLEYISNQINPHSVLNPQICLRV